MSNPLDAAVAAMRTAPRLRFTQYYAGAPSVAESDRRGEGSFVPSTNATVVKSALMTPRTSQALGPERSLVQVLTSETETRFEGGVRFVRADDDEWIRGFSSGPGTTQLADPMWGLQVLATVGPDQDRETQPVPPLPPLAEEPGLRVEIAWSRVRLSKAFQVPGRLECLRLARALGRRDLPIFVWFASDPWIRALSHPQSILGGKPQFRTVTFHDLEPDP